MNAVRRESTVTAVSGISKIPREEWNALVDDEVSPFLDWDWLHAMEASKSALPATGWAPHHLVVREGGKIVAACPLYLKSHSMGEFVFDHGWADAAAQAGIGYYPKLMAGVPFTPHSGRRFLTLAREDRQRLVNLPGRALASL